MTFKVQPPPPPPRVLASISTTRHHHHHTHHHHLRGDTQTLADENATPEQISRPGHIFPLVAKYGGVLERRGHTEAGIDLCMLSGTQPVGLLCEMTHDDGTMMRLPACETFAEKHGLKLINIEQLARFRKEQGLTGRLAPGNAVATRVQHKIKQPVRSFPHQTPQMIFIVCFCSALR